MRCHMIVVTVALVVGLIAEDVFAQRTTGATAGRTMGSQTTAGTRTFAAGTGGAGGLGSAGGFGTGSAGIADSSDRFMRDNRQGAFVGADSGDASAFVGSEAAGSAQAARNIRRGGGGAAPTNVNRGGGRGRQSNEVRTVLKIGFARPNMATISPSRTPAAIAGKLAGRMERSSWIQNRSSLEVSIDQGTATLRGVVATEHGRVLAERLALLEAGIWEVNNQLQIQPVESESLEAPELLDLTPAPVTE